MSRYYFHLKDVPVKHPLSEIGKIWFDTLPEECHVNIPSGYFSDELKEWLDSVGLYIFDGEVFSMPANYQLQIHVDGEYFQEKCKLNWAYSDGEQYNTWYKPKSNWDRKSTAEQQDDGVLDDYSFVFEPEEVEEIDRCTLHNPTAVCSGHPHSVITTTHPRKSISVTVFKKGTVPQLKDWGIQYDELKEVLRDYVLQTS
jgi:hypothetical protein